MTKGTLLITGATGYVGSAILIGALQEGYNAHIVVRSESKMQFLLKAPAIASLGKDAQCKYFIVPDLALPGALDDAAAGTTHVVHAAAPLPGHDTTPDREEAEVIQPAVNTTLVCLESARRAGTVKRFVYISSLIAFAAPAFFRNEIPPDQGVRIGPGSLQDYWTPPYGGGLLTYGASKTAALQRCLGWTRDAIASSEGLGFDLVCTAFAYVIGHHPLAENTADLFATSNGMVLRSAAGNESSSYLEMSGGVHIDDVVTVHLRALDVDSSSLSTDDRKKGIEILTFAVCWQYEDINALTDKFFPEAVKDGLLANKGSYKSRPKTVVDSSRVEELCGIHKWKDLDEQLQSILTQYLELLKTEKGQDPVEHKLWQTQAKV